ncbi:gamma-glutamylcyclotransferase family protein [Azospirillum sp. SYSU D00513]|uniref:gamma-glutamylcyclotransferase family protein n=1 Tax=Azospirillum sp. SYSU D00513 TaxID=2812561 RepID=UPI001A975799|nr:gamma-glutamylcyclotransferase family protein [Azospirillum sp. SYSU D00513]
MTNTIKLAAYGTLRLGQPNWGRFLPRAVHLGTHRIAGFRLFDGGAYPYAVPGGTGGIVADLFSIDAATLRQCDLLEGHPDHYARRLVPVARHEVWLYCVERAPHGLRPIAHGDWVEHIAPGSAVRAAAGVGEGR